jgi:cellulose synthase/poly-beta-1,6-N-acetylglucosamine synthase-like glycosyltransferase
MITFLFWALIMVCFYLYFGYPVLLILVGLLRQRSISKKDITPSVTLLIPAYNEEAVMAAKLDNALALDYPRQKLDILVVSDGSDDSTGAIVRRYSQQGVRLLALPRRGKASALNSAAPHARGTIIAFSDANAILEPDALRILVQSFHDPQVGGVCGNLKQRSVQQSDSVRKGDSLYWRYDKFVKRMESYTGSITFAAGSVYAIRKELFVPISDLGAVDDVAISSAVVKQGYRLVYERDAVSYEEEGASTEGEFRRKSRLVNIGLRALLATGLFNPFRYGFYAWKVISHKILRRLVGYFLIVILLLNIILALNNASVLYRLTLLAQIVLYVVALVGYLLRRSPWGQKKVFYIPFYFVMVNVAAMVGVWELLRGERIVSWQPVRE